MKTKFIRSISFLTALAAAFCAVQAPACAAETDTPASAAEEAAEPEQTAEKQHPYLLRGSCGSLVYFYFNTDTEELTLYGMDEMFDYADSFAWDILPEGGIENAAPWAKWIQFQVRTAVVREGVTTIGSGAFSSCPELTAVTLPESLTAIGAGAFNGCSQLQTLTIPASVTEIGKDAFGCCMSLTIYGYRGSVAEAYANEYGIRFVSLGAAPQPETDEPAETTAAESAAVTEQTAVTRSYVAGDMSGDGSLSISDILLLCRYVSCDSALSPSFLELLHPENCDADGDGILTMLDVTAFLHILQDSSFINRK